MKNFKRILALVLAVMMVATSVVAISAAEADEKVVYNAEAITRLNKLGIFQGYNAADMGADDNVTRAQMALFTGRVLTGKVESNYWESYVNDTTFEDIDDVADYYVGAISYAYEQGVVIGKSDVAFDPNGNVTYQEALTMVVRSLGYTGLSYPNGFINKAMKLGLTNGIANVAYGDAAVRGVIATILYNALYAEDSLFADNFNLTSGTYMLVATPTVVRNKDYKIPGASINGYIGKELNEGYVAFAPIGEDNRAVNIASKYVYARVSQIADDVKGNQVDDHYADKLGYAYNLTFENDVLTWGDECATKTFKNYGDNREISATYIDYDHKLVPGQNGWEFWFDSDWFLTFGGQAYNLVDGYDKDYTAPTSTQNLILYSDYGSMGTFINDYVQMFDKDGNIVDVDGTVLLKWDTTVNAYLKKSAHTGDFTVKATAEDILNAVAFVEANNAMIDGKDFEGLWSDYEVIDAGSVIAPSQINTTLGNAASFNYAATIANNYFCEITAMDYDNDGLYDAAIYTPWYVGTVGNVKDHDSDGVNEFSLTGITTFDGTKELFAGNVCEVDDYVVTGAATSFGSYAPWLYKFNRLTNEINVIERAASVSGKVEWGVKGMVTYPTNIYEDSQVSIGGKTWAVGGWTYSNLYGLKNFHKMDAYRIGNMKNAMAAYYRDVYNIVLDTDKITNEYQNGWNDVLDYGMTSDCSSFVGFAIAGHLISGVPTLSAAADYSYVAFNAYQSEFAIENDQIVVDAIVDASGKYQTIKINSVDSNEFTEIEFLIFCDYIETLYGTANDLDIYTSYFFNEARREYHKSTALYKAIEREYIIDRLTENYFDLYEDDVLDNAKADETTTLVYAVGGKNEDGSYVLYNYKNTTKPQYTYKALIEFNLGISDNGFVANYKGELNSKPIRTNANTVFTFVAKDGIYTYVGMPENGYQIDLTAAPDKAVVVADSNNIMIIDTTRCISDIATVSPDYLGVVDADWSEKVQDVARKYVPHDPACVETLLTVDGLDNALRCDYIAREHRDTWAFVEYVPYVEATFHADEVYMVTAKTANTKIYYDNDVHYYVYSNLYNLVDGKYEEAVIFTGAEVAVFQDSLLAKKDTFYENSKGDISTNYGLVITRDNGQVACWTYDEFKDAANANKVFNLADAFGNLTDLKRGVYEGQTKDNTGAVSHIVIDGNPFVVNKVEFVTVYNTSGIFVEVGTFANIAKGAVMFYNYDAVTGTLTGYAFNSLGY